MMNYEEIRNYWENRAAGDSSAQSTTQDVYLREIEVKTLIERVNRYAPRHVADIGCGDGRTTIRLAEVFGDVRFCGFDYSQSMIANARDVLSANPVTNVVFDQSDVTAGLRGSFDLIYTTRCLINLSTWDLQKKALRTIHQSLNKGGVYLMIENFLEGHENFNKVRKEFGLPEIPIREHNFFFQRQRLFDYTNELFEIIEEENISSVYYLVSRVVYSKICLEHKQQPDYFDDHHRFAASLPFCGEFGPVRLIIFQKK